MSNTHGRTRDAAMTNEYLTTALSGPYFYLTLIFISKYMYMYKGFQMHFIIYNFSKIQFHVHEHTVQFLVIVAPICKCFKIENVAKMVN